MFTGTYTALLTPFTKKGAIDEKSFRALVEYQIAGGVDGIIPCGTTGESPTLSHEEHNHLVELAVKFAAGRCKVIAGTGSNSTDEAIAMTTHAAKAGADGSLQVAPYYNKPTQAGLYAHFRAIAETSPKLPIILYNIPGRCGVDIANETTAKLYRDVPQICCLKEATGSVDRVSQLRQLVDDKFTILSGDDALTLPMMAVGARGVVSVVSNLLPREVGDMVRAALKGDFARAEKLHATYYPIFKDAFIEANPIPIKAALAMKGMMEETYRLPIVPMGAANRKSWEATLKKIKIL